MLYDPSKEKKFDVQLEDWQQCLLDGIDHISRYGWCQGDYRRGDAYCLLGSIGGCRSGCADVRYLRARAAVAEVLRKRGWRFWSLPHTWNDAAGRSKEEVIALMYEAATK